MSCGYPLKGFVIGKTEKGKDFYKIVPFRAKGVYQSDGTSWKVDYDVGHALPSMRKYVSQFTEIPCGKCSECRKAYARQWADRCMLELPYHVNNYFITLTYDDEHIKRKEGFNPVTGEKTFVGTLEKADFQDFIKRCRRKFSYLYETTGNERYNVAEKLKYYASGEYGSSSRRPHYHMIVYDFPLDDLVFFKKSTEGFNYYTSETLNKLWPFGFTMICDVTWETCAYVAKYVAKKLNGDLAKVYECFNIQPEFSIMSRRPGIGKQYFLDHKDEIYKTDYISLVTAAGGKNIYPPRYFDNLYDLDSPELMNEIKENRKYFSENRKKALCEKSDKQYIDILAADCEAKKSKSLVTRGKV